MISSRICTTDSCKRAASVLCIGCEQDFCIVHLNKHSDSLITQCLQLTDVINRLFDQVKNSSMPQSVFLTELDQWCQEVHRKIDKFCEKKKQEFEEISHKERNQQTTELARLRDQVTQFISEQEVTENFIDSIGDSIQLLQHQIDQFQSSHLILHPLVIDNDLVAFYQQISSYNDLLPLSSPQRSIELKNNWYSLAAKDNFLLVKNDSKLCIFDKQLNVVKETNWTHSVIVDMFWSKRLSQFIIICFENIFILDENSMTINQLPIPWNRRMKSWSCGTCTSDYLFLSVQGVDPCMYKYTLLPSIQLIKEYRSPMFFKEDERIQDLSSNKNLLAMIIANREKKVRLDLCSSTTFQRKWSIEFNEMAGLCAGRCCMLSNNEWMMMNPYDSELLHISKDGKIIKKSQYESSPIHAVLLGNNHLVIMTHKNINLHKFS
ncbi:unnamed protein product [Rotaria sp. Silwood2]|nr:unnamed protein product [Rotaria sp. Silwood2]CAF3005455.1 unnamed protein product [Rotaria sp. Silwood2]CAF3358861.1 unnamed protein product [Rotaria sp. Silwood2]CAF4115621.1 unnamed protein product [Rotaria sp. Silwood2]CAF4202453.1 unnamed protein product [Rotaria sp. Silwood2]